MFWFLILCLITPIYTYCFPEQFSNMTDTSLCTLTVQESQGCQDGFYVMGAGLKTLTMKCNPSTQEYHLPQSEYGQTVVSVVIELIEALKKYNVTPTCVTTSGNLGDYCPKHVVRYSQTICTFQIPEWEVYEPACFGVNIYLSLGTFLLLTIFWIIHF